MKNKKIKICYLLIIVLLLCSLLTLIFPSKSYVADNYEIKDQKLLKNLKTGDHLKQEFYVINNYSKIGILYANYNKLIENGYIYIKLTDQNNNVQNKKVKLSSISDNSYFFVNCKLKKNTKYIMDIKIVGSEMPIALYTTSAEVEYANLEVNGKKVKNNLAMSFMYSTNNYFNIWYYIFGISILLFFVVLNRNNEE